MGAHYAACMLLRARITFSLYLICFCRRPMNYYFFFLSFLLAFTFTSTTHLSHCKNKSSNGRSNFSILYKDYNNRSSFHILHFVCRGCWPELPLHYYCLNSLLTRIPSCTSKSTSLIVSIRKSNMWK